MNKTILFGGIVGALLLSVSGSTTAILAELGDFTDVVVRDENGEVTYYQTLEPSNPLLVKTQHFYRLSAVQENEDAAKPGGGGGTDPGTDCESDAYKLAGWSWSTPYSAKSDSYASSVSSSLSEWDSNTGASISGGANSGSSGTAGVYDGVNQIAWVSLGASSTVAVTTTWYYRGSGQAVESDGQYNTYYPWSTSGASDAMDVESVTQHETGHTFGLNHPTSTSTNACLTMYAYVNYGATHGRTLGDGDILGIKAIYGN